MKKFAFLCAGAALLIGATSAAQATTTFNCTQIGCSLTVVQGNPQPSETFVYFDALAGTTSGTGHVGSQTGTDLLNFATDVNSTFANGFATITADSTLISTLTITSTTGLQWNDMLFGVSGPSGSGATPLMVEAFLGATSLGSVSIDDIGSGNQAFLAYITVSGLMDKLVISCPTDPGTGCTQFKQFEISAEGIPPTIVPLPPAALLFGTALVGMVLLGRRRRKTGLAAAA